MSKGRNKGSSREIRRELEVVQVLFQVAKKRRIKKEKEAKKQKKSVMEGLEEVTMQSFIELALSHEQLRERRKMEKKLQKLAKTMDYMERAKREETTPLIEAAFQQRLVEEKVLHEREQQQEVELSRQRHTRDFQEKNRLVRMMDNKMIFQERVMNKEREERISQLIAIRSRERETKRKMIFYLRSVEERLKKLHEDEEARKHEGKMSTYENVVGGKLKLKGKALDVKAGGIKKKKKHRKHYDRISQDLENELSTGGSTGLSTDPIDPTEEDTNEGNKSSGEGHGATYDDNLTPAEKRYIEQRERIDVRRLAKTSNKSHRDRIQDFNQYLANMSEHYDIPKVGPG
ncbi:hypothetical protein HHK36_026142 [Tetracentron sinense]|uniref:Uncharacterized protein n=1 Tax=Tetracentron sinense TaxID=13715 RepID=A0A835D692_TETSI|nr:hypothetical protein HHK36_026142 [Tetracentron sinense]